MDIYNLINSRAIQEHCRKIQHKFNTEELAVLIYRNKRMSIEEKISAYQELITDYSDMEVIERINCKHYDSVKDMIQQEIERLRNLRQEMQTESINMIYTYEIFYALSQKFEESNNLYKTYDETCVAIYGELKEDTDNEILMIRIIKRSFLRDKKKIIEENVVTNNKNIKLINIYDTGEYLDIDGICLNIPTPFRKGDILVSYANSPFNHGTVFNHGKYPFVLHNLCTWREKFQENLDKENCDSSDMEGTGYYISDNEIILENNYDYDNWEYFDGELKGPERILKAISSLINNEISVEIFVRAYDYIRSESYNRTFLSCFTDKSLKLSGLTDEDIQKIRNK